MSNQPHQTGLLLAHAAWTELEGLAKAYEAATLRGDLAAVERLRQRAHDVLDAFLDQKDATAVAVRSLMGR